MMSPTLTISDVKSIIVHKSKMYGKRECIDISVINANGDECLEIGLYSKLGDIEVIND